jgi:hypothetical protein
MMAGEILYDKLNPTQVVNQAIRDDRSRPVDQHKYLQPGNAMRCIRTFNNVFNLVPGTYPAPTFAYPGTMVQGTAGTVLAGMTVEGQAIIRDVRFSGTITIAAAGKVVFDRCYFEAATTVVSGGQASFNGCHFEAPVTNGGLVADVGILGCSRTGSAHVNVTIIFEVA